VTKIMDIRKESSHVRQVRDKRKGKHSNFCYSKVVEDKAIEQICRMCDYPCTKGRARTYVSCPTFMPEKAVHRHNYEAYR